MKAIVLTLLATVTIAVKAQETPALKLTKTIPLPGVTGRFDHMAVDAKGKRLFVAALGNNTLEVVDVAASKHLESITGLRKPTGVLYLPDANQIAVANGDDGTLNIFDGATYKLVRSIGSFDDADNIRYDATAGLIYLGYGSGALAIIDSKKLERVGEIKLKGHPESFQLEKNGDRIFVNVPDRKEVAVIDRKKREVVGEWHAEKFEANFPMALDEANHRVLIGCRKPVPWIFILNSTNGGFVKVHGIAGDTDDLFYDAKRHRLYASCGEGFVVVVSQKDADTYEDRGRIATRAAARTSCFSPELDQIYLAVPKRGNLDAELRVYRPE